MCNSTKPDTTEVKTADTTELPCRGLFGILERATRTKAVHDLRCAVLLLPRVRLWDTRRAAMRGSQQGLGSMLAAAATLPGCVLH